MVLAARLLPRAVRRRHLAEWLDHVESERETGGDPRGALRSRPRDPKARLVLEWADVAFYIFTLALTAVVLVLAVVNGVGRLH
jgi:hypothetical protein